MLSSIKARVIVFYVVILFTILPALGVFLYISLGKIIYNAVDSSLLSAAKALATLVTNENGETQFNFSDEIMWEYNSTEAKNFFQIRRFGGTTVEKSRSLRNLELPLPSSQNRISYQTIDLDGESVRLVNFRFMDYGDDEQERKIPGVQGNVSGFIIQCAVNIDEQADLLENYRLILCLSIFSIMMISAAGGFFIARKALSPIKEISDTINGISESNLSEKISSQNEPKELRGLADSFNHMFERLEKSFNRQKQFVADASHELRTPLSIILSQSEVMLRKERSVREYKTALTAIKEASEMMSEIVGKLLTLARLSAEKIELKIEAVDLSEVIHQAVKTVTPLATRRGIGIKLQLCERPVIPGDRAALLELVGNVLENAIKYNVLDGKIDIAVKKENSFLIIKIQDTGIGISRKDMDKVFDRFYRADKSRSKEAGGIGLGLSICKEIVRLHEGRIEIESMIGMGTTVSIYLKEKGDIATNWIVAGKETRGKREINRMHYLDYKAEKIVHGNEEQILLDWKHIVMKGLQHIHLHVSLKITGCFGLATAATSIRTILAALILFTLTPIIIWAEPNQFRMFFHRNLLYGITGVSCAYLAVFWINLCRIRIIKRWMFRGLYLLNAMNVVSRPRFRTWSLKVSHELDLFPEGFKRYFRNSPG